MNVPIDYFDEQLAGLDSARTIFVGDLSYFCNEEDLFSLFAQFGNIMTVRVRRGVTGESLMHGFIAMETTESANAAISSLDGMEFMGRNIRVQLSSDGQRNPISKDSLVQVHVSFISKQNAFLVTEKILRDIFSPFGSVADVAIKKHVAVPKQGRQSGYGFVYYFDINSAYRALQALKQNTVRDITLDCSISHKSETRIRQNHPPNNQSNPVFDRAQGFIPYPGTTSAATSGAQLNPTNAYPPAAPYQSRPTHQVSSGTFAGPSRGMNAYPQMNTIGQFTGVGSPAMSYPNRDASGPNNASNKATTNVTAMRPAERQHPMAAVYNPTGGAPTSTAGSVAYYGSSQKGVSSPYASYNNRPVDRTNMNHQQELNMDFNRLQLSSYPVANNAGSGVGPRHTLAGASRLSANSSPRSYSPREGSPRSISPRAPYDFAVPGDNIGHMVPPLGRIPVSYPPTMDNLSVRTDSFTEYESSLSRSRSRSPRAGSPPLGHDMAHRFETGLNFGLNSLGNGNPLSSSQPTARLPFSNMESNSNTHSFVSTGTQSTLSSDKNSSMGLLSGLSSSYGHKLSRSGSDHGIDSLQNGQIGSFPLLIPQNHLQLSQHPQRTPTESIAESLSRQSVDSLLSSVSPTSELLLNEGSARQYLLEEDNDAYPEVADADTARNVSNLLGNQDAF